MSNENLEERLESEILANLVTYLLLYCVKQRKVSYGYEMKRFVEEYIDRPVPEGTLYPIISKLGEKKYQYLSSSKNRINSLRPDIQDDRVRTYYQLTPKGEQAIQSWFNKWKEVVEMVNSILQTIGQQWR